MSNIAKLRTRSEKEKRRTKWWKGEPFKFPGLFAFCKPTLGWHFSHSLRGLHRLSLCNHGKMGSMRRGPPTLPQVMLLKESRNSNKQQNQEICQLFQYLQICSLKNEFMIINIVFLHYWPGSFMSIWHKLTSSERGQSPLRKCLHKIKL